MSDVSTRKPAAATTAARANGRGVPVVDAPPLQPTGIKALRDANAIAIHWWSTLDMIREQAKYGEGRKDTVPQWVLDAIGDWRTQQATYDAHKALVERAGQALRIAGEGPTSLVYELWTDRGHRLDGQYDFRADADAALTEWLAQYPDAKVTLVHRQSPTFGGTVDPALLDTLIGRTFWAGCFFADEQHQQDIHTVQDETGRCAYAPTSELLAHPCFARMTRKGQERVQFSASEATRKAQLRASAEKGGA